MAKATRATLRERWQDWLPQYLEHGVDGVLRAAAAEGIELSATNVKAYYWSKGIKRRELMRARKRAAQPLLRLNRTTARLLTRSHATSSSRGCAGRSASGSGSTRRRRGDIRSNRRSPG